MVTRVSSGLAWVISLLCVALAAGSLILGPLNGRTPGEILIDENIVGIAILTIAFSVVGVLIASHRPENAIGWVFCAAAFFQGALDLRIRIPHLRAPHRARRVLVGGGSVVARPVRETVQPAHASLWLRDPAPDGKPRIAG
ncbi:MAG: hypothetical protein M3151_03785 [Actinomycetota bacterium]|nr:hypothetical protein [Actinomycetota bacterium]